LIEYQIVSDHLRRRAKVLNGEVLWPWADVLTVLEELAAGGRVILGYDMFIFPGSGVGPQEVGSCDFSSDLQLDCSTWRDTVNASLVRARETLAHTADRTGLQPPFDDLWFAVVASNANSLPRPANDSF
jgi:hypothetical protein